MERVVDKMRTQPTGQGGKAHDRQQRCHPRPEIGSDQDGCNVVGGQGETGTGGQGRRRAAQSHCGQLGREPPPAPRFSKTCTTRGKVAVVMEPQIRVVGRFDEIVGDSVNAEHSRPRQRPKQEPVTVLQDHCRRGHCHQRPRIFDQSDQFRPVQELWRFGETAMPEARYRKPNRGRRRSRGPE